MKTISSISVLLLAGAFAFTGCYTQFAVVQDDETNDAPIVILQPEPPIIEPVYSTPVHPPHGRPVRPHGPYEGGSIGGQKVDKPDNGRTFSERTIVQTNLAPSTVQRPAATERPQIVRTPDAPPSRTPAAAPTRPVATPVRDAASRR